MKTLFLIDFRKELTRRYLSGCVITREFRQRVPVFDRPFIVKLCTKQSLRAPYFSLVIMKSVSNQILSINPLSRNDLGIIGILFLQLSYHF